MIKEFVEIEIVDEKIQRKYLKLGYLCEIGDVIHFPFKKLSKGSHILVEVMCDFCGKELKKQYNVYNRETKCGELPVSCFECMSEKRKYVTEKKYGVKNVSQLDDTKNKVKERLKNRSEKKSIEIKNKRKETNKKKFGKEWVTQTDIFKEKSKITSLNKYGEEYPTQSDEVKNKIVKTCMDKYGYDSYMKTMDFKEKSKNEIKRLYGVEYVSQSDIVKNKVKETNLKKYNNEHYRNTEKNKKTCLEKYGNNNYRNTEKNKKTCLEKYGTEYYNQSNLYKNYVKKRKIENLTKKYKINIVDIDENNFIISHCDECGENFKLSYQQLLNRHNYKTILCSNCNPINVAISGHEMQLLGFIKNNHSDKILTNVRNIVNPYELDIYLPDLKLAFEFNGLFWHNELSKSNNYHLEKTELAENQGIKLVHIYEDDWIYKQEIVKSRILNLLNKTPNKIYARKCEIKEVSDNKLVRNFLETNHIQGFVGSKIKIGLFHDNELVSLMTFGSLRKAMGQKGEEGSYEMLRFCNKLNTNVIGGASRLFMFFVKNFEPKEVTSYADRSWSQGVLYKNLGFELIRKTEPNYYYVIDGVRRHRFGFRKDQLIKEGFDPLKTEHEIMLERKIYRIYDSGNLKFIWNKLY